MRIKSQKARMRAMFKKQLLTPRNKYKQAIRLLASNPVNYCALYDKADPEALASDLLAYSWSNRHQLYKRINAMGWHWEKGRVFGRWSNVPF